MLRWSTPRLKYVLVGGVIDPALGLLAFVAAVALYVGPAVATVVVAPHVLVAALAFAALTGVGSFATGLAAAEWRYVSISDVQRMVVTIAAATIAVMVSAGLLSGSYASVAVPGIAGVLLLALLVASRVILRQGRLAQISVNGRPVRKTVVLVGADSNAEACIRAVNENASAKFVVAGVFDDRGRRKGLNMRGVPVISSIAELSELAERTERLGAPLTRLILTKERGQFELKTIDQLIEWASNNGCRLMQPPDLRMMEHDDAQWFALEPLRIADLLNRPETNFRSRKYVEAIAGRTVLVTGAGGSIGSALVRLISASQPERLVLLDSNERNLHQIDCEIARTFGHRFERHAILCDVRDRKHVFEVFEEFHPDLVFHAAALKHVPIVERQPMAGLMTNVIGTQNVADAARDVAAKSMVMISTDKAVNPASVMGASKRMAEAYCQALDTICNTRFVTVRFGNVLGSSGSVVPLFEQQIREGGPVTVTHEAMTRYLMTIPEASQLVLHAMVLALGQSNLRGHIHVLDMGEPIKILDLAERMIQLRGLRPYVDVDISIVGLRPGEKLFEELFSNEEDIVVDSQDGVLVGLPPTPHPTQTVQLIQRLGDALASGDQKTALAVLQAAVPEARLSLEPDGSSVLAERTGLAPREASPEKTNVVLFSARKTS